MDSHSSPKRFFSRLGSVVPVLGGVGGVIAILTFCFGIYQYRQNSVAAQAKETLEYVKRYYDNPVLNSSARNALLQQVFEFNKSLKRKELSPNDYQTWLNNDYDALVISGYRDGFKKGDSLEGDAAVLVSFFEDLKACTCAKLCDLDLVLHFFVSTANILKDQMRPYIEFQQKKEPGFGDGLFRLANGNGNNSDFISMYCGQH
jgi:hypothetical protein